MKSLYTFTLLLVSGFVFAQPPSPYKNIKLENSQVFFEKVYLMDSLSASNIERLLVEQMPRVKNLKGFSKSDGIITARIEECAVDYKKYGGKWGNTLLHLNHPLFSNVSIVWKDGKYKVVMSNMEWHAAGIGTVSATDLFTKWGKGKDWDMSKTVLKGGEYVDLYFSDLFKVTSRSKDDW